VKIPVIKKMAESYSIDQLNDAETMLMNEERLQIEVEGDDPGEQLTHIIAAREIKVQMVNEGLDLNGALRNYTKRVRNSIS
jgi:hypothetical protein